MHQQLTKKIVLLTLAVISLVSFVVGISYAAYSYQQTSTSANTINAGTISMTYTEPVTGIVLTDSLPVDDATAKVWQDAGQVFSFSVSATSTGTVSVPYEISIQKTEATLENSQVKVYLTKGTLGNETAVYGPNLMSSLMVSANKSTLRTDVSAYKIHKETINFVNGSASNSTVNYHLRIWVDSAATVTSGLTYKILVHVDSVVMPVG